MKLYHYIFICFFCMTILLLQVKGSYSSASYNPVKDEIVTYRENVPDYVYAHEAVHQRMWWESYLIFFAAVLTMLGLAVGTKYTKYPYLAYILLSVHAELTAYLLTPIAPILWATMSLLILNLGIVNLYFWQYLFVKTDMLKPMSQFTVRDKLFPPFIALFFWLV